MALRNLNKAPEFTATVEAGLKAKPGDADLEKLLLCILHETRSGCTKKRKDC